VGTYRFAEAPLLSETIRGFLAFEIEDENIKQKLLDMQTLAVQTGADLKLVEPENIHITIRFLGDITLQAVDKIYAEMKKLSFRPFIVNISGLGVFPSLSYPRVLWAGITMGADELQNIFRQLEPALQRIGLSPDPKGFNPHITLARVRSAANKSQLAELVKINADCDFGTLPATCLKLKRSELTPKGPIYSTLKEHCPK
jgi:2'-5' RNA ligase